MERGNLDTLYMKALQLHKATSSIQLQAERLKGAKRYKETTLRETLAFLEDFKTFSETNTFSEIELSKMLGNNCLEVGSFLFSAGAPCKDWMEWCSLAGSFFYLGQDLSYAMQLLAISRMIPSDNEMSSVLGGANLKSYREQAIQYIIFRPTNSQPPSLFPAHPLDDYYQAMIQSLESSDEAGITHAINQIVEFWLNETSYGKFEPGVFPAFEPEINSTVSAFVMQGINLDIRSTKVRNFLRAALEPGS